jgi:hypothetical protein
MKWISKSARTEVADTWGGLFIVLGIVLAFALLAIIASIFPPTPLQQQEGESKFAIDEFRVGDVVVEKFPNAAEWRMDVGVYQIIGATESSFIAAPAFTEGNRIGYSRKEIANLRAQGHKVAIIPKAVAREAILNAAFPPEPNAPPPK